MNIWKKIIIVMGVLLVGWTFNGIYQYPDQPWLYIVSALVGGAILGFVYFKVLKDA